jgi:hypothetical protein
MKKIYLLIFTLVINWSFSQVVFCPPGAEWHYLFNTNNLSPIPNYANETVKYIGDSIMGTDTVKILSHNRFFQRYNLEYADYTFIKQKGDTIFMRNKFTQNTWQILYNFNDGGQGWTTHLNYKNPQTINFAVTYVGDTTLNGKQLRVMNAVYTNNGKVKIVERLGVIGFLFPFRGPSSDGDYCVAALCYFDNEIGEHKYTEKPCNFSNLVGIKESNLQDLKIFPNPFTSILSFTTINSSILKLFDVTGKLVLTERFDEQISEATVNTGFLPPGIYYCLVQSKGAIIGKKLIKK